MLYLKLYQTNFTEPKRKVPDLLVEILWARVYAAVAEGT